MPGSILGDSIEQFVDDVRDARKIKLKRSRGLQLDSGTTVTMEHTALLARDVEDDLKTVQELCLNIDHLSNKHDPRNTLDLRVHPRFRTLLRFERTTAEDSWIYKGTYTGKLESGELTGDLIQTDPRLGVPSNPVLDKALTFLTELAVTPKQP